MNYNKLRYFYEVAKSLNMTRAAEQLYISQSALSRHIKELEQDFNVPLFTRTNRDLILTGAGKVLFQESERIFSGEQELYQKVRRASFSEDSRLSIGFMGIKPAFYIPKIVKNMLQEYPELMMSMKRYNWDDIVPALKCDEINIALRLRISNEPEPGMETLLLDQSAPAILVSSRHPCARKQHVQLSDFQNDTFFMLSELDSTVPYSYTQNLFKQHNFHPAEIVKYNQSETILMMVHTNSGVSLLSEFAATDQFDDIIIKPLKETTPLYLELVWQKNVFTRYHAEFVKRLSEKYRQENPAKL